MIRNSFILIFAACLTGISVSAGEVEFPFDYDDQMYIDDYSAEYRSQYDIGDSSVILRAANPTQETDLGNTTENSPNGTELSLVKYSSKQIVKYIVFTRERNTDEVSTFPVLDPKKETYLLIPGHMGGARGYNYNNDDYQKQFCHNLGKALSEECDCNVVGVRWFINGKPHPMKKLINGASVVGQKLAGSIYKIIRKQKLNENFTIISHHLGNVAATDITNILRSTVRYVYALDQIPLPAPFRNYYIRQDSSYLVQTITTGGFKRNYGHRNFYPNGGNYSYPFDHCFFCQSFRLLEDSIRGNGHEHQCLFCSTYEAYMEHLCEYFPEASYFNRIPPEELPYGNYYIAEDIIWKQK